MWVLSKMMAARPLRVGRRQRLAGVSCFGFDLLFFVQIRSGLINSGWNAALLDCNHPASPQSNLWHDRDV